MKILSVLVLVVFLSVGVVLGGKPDPVPKSRARATEAELTALVADTHWAWYEGNFDRYREGMPYWVEFYKDGFARVPWREHPQLWTVKKPDMVILSDSGIHGDKHIFYMNPALKSGSAGNQNLHIRFEKGATRPEGWK